jgi:cell division protein FtsB
MADRRTRRVPVALPRPSGPSENWLRGIRFSGFSLLMMAMLILGVVILAPTLHLLLAQRQTITDLKDAVAHESDKVASVKAQRARWNDPSYVRSQVRDRLYYVMPGETSYLILDDRSASAKASDKAPVSAKIQKTPTDWLGSLFASTVTAGLTDATPAQLGDPASPTTAPGRTGVTQQ